MTLSSGTRLGPYRIDAVLGAGGMGEVYRALDTRLGRVVAIKVIRSREGVDSEQRRRFRREAVISARLTHPHVCTLFDVGAEGDLDYLVLEHLTGCDLGERLAGGALSLDESLSIASEIADALAFAHGLGFVHRDLKPGNVFLTSAGAKLLDFGLARAASVPPAVLSDTASTADAPLTVEGGVCGTPPYMSPEQAAGRAVDARSDQFALGSLLFEMATGRRAFRGASAVEALSAVLRDDPLTSEEGRRIGPELAGLLGRLLAKDPEGRFPSTADVAVKLKGLRRAGDAANLPATLPVTTAAAPRASSRRWRVAAAAVGVALVVALAAAVWVRRGVKASSQVDSLAVLPLGVASGDTEIQLVADGVTESLVNSLGGLPSLRVMALSSVQAYRGREADPRAVGRALAVHAVLSGRLVRQGANVVLGLALADARDGRHLWGATYERPALDVASVQALAAGDVARRLERVASEEEGARLARPATEDHEAYLLYLKGRYFLGQRRRESLLKGVEQFRQALAKDPLYARAWAGLGEAYDVLGYGGYLPRSEAFPQAREAAAKAIELDPTLADAWAVSAHVAMLFTGDHADAETRFQKAIALNPSSAIAHHWYSHLLMVAKRWEESLRESRAALEVDPLSLVMNTHLGEHLFAAGEVDAAIAQLEKTIEMDSQFGLAHVFLGHALLRKGRDSEAVAELETAVRLLPDSVDTLGNLGSTLARVGRKEDATEIVGRLRALRASRFVSPATIAKLLLDLGDREGALVELESASARGERVAAEVRSFGPRFAALEDEPRYRALLSRGPADGHGADGVPKR